ncbi:sensor histidine kinase [Saccharibacillus kuerlensis]|uniref:Oxygen sensor histidine kinase NreB n=1 Tax=Saccharibacillus kuerlensis TaxID=459527 RepID=A0ABQ2KUV3_9BACL|nr:sensor histidine kinase [Saccharibacillus kuerlensis]GGN92245.1 sensor histidine kinase [Saccharibacillus kuerlensis]
MGNLLKNTKWELLFYFLLSGGILAALLYWSSLYGFVQVFPRQIWLFYLLASVLVAVITGYIAGQRIQRRIDVLHYSMLQVSQGNLSLRLGDTEDQSFARVYREFNVMMDSIENKTKLLQKLGENEAVGKEQLIESAVREERRRMARDLHDSVSQQMFAIHMSAASLPKVLERNPAAAEPVMQQLIQMSNLAQRQMRALITQLRPVELEGTELPEALDRWFPDYCIQNGLKGVQDVELCDELSEAIEQQLFLIVQEAMANIVKHAQASMVSLSLRENERQVLLSISDDGRGFSGGAPQKQGSYGLMTMRERAEKLGGRAEILSKPGAGTTVRIHIPKFTEGKAVEENGQNQNSAGGRSRHGEDGVENLSDAGARV